ncbi:hypothetical protein B0H19DRAFT_867001, partial [Mycena capillaripes]
LQLFGAVYFDTNPVIVTICGFCKNSGKHTATAGSAAYFGPGSAFNRTLRVWGKPTNSRADLIALLIAVEAAPRTKNLRVSTRSEYAIREITFHAFRNQACGWPSVNGDILWTIIQAIKGRAAPLHFVHIKKDEIHGGLEAAKHLAE